MSLLADLEKALVEQLALASIDSREVFATIAGASGPVSQALQQALLRELLPAAYIVFISEKLAPELDPLEFGPRFSVLLADRALRQNCDSRFGDPPSFGLYAMIEQTHATLDSYAPAGIPVVMIPIAQNALFSDARQAIYQLTFQARPTP